MDVGRSTEVCGLSGRVQGVNIVNEPEAEVDRRHGRNLQTVDAHGMASACPVNQLKPERSRKDQSREMRWLWLSIK